MARARIIRLADELGLINKEETRTAKSAVGGGCRKGTCECDCQYKTTTAKDSRSS